jgi:hypothetical protein
MTHKRDHPMTSTVVRFAITHVSKSNSLRGLRVLTFANQARFHYDTKEAAQAALDVLAPSLREKVLGDAADTLLVRGVECYESGDAMRTVFGDDPITESEPPTTPATPTPELRARCEVCEQPIRDGLRFCSGLSLCFRIANRLP